MNWKMVGKHTGRNGERAGISRRRLDVIRGA
uniref:Uncharacterized protein n=1 Tax=Arundo donax TaxID=35708 RepID=A0A0A8YA08_ARUDO